MVTLPRFLVVFAGVALLSSGRLATVVALEIPDSEIEYAVEFREAHGFRADLPYVLSAANDRLNFPQGEWGIPLSDAEATELRRRDEVQRQIHDAAVYAESESSHAGVYIDQLDRGVPVFSFAVGLAGRESEIRNRLPAGTEFRLRSVARSWADLQALRAVVERDRDALGEIAIVTTGIDTKANSVAVGVKDLTSWKQDVLAARYGPGVIFANQDYPLPDTCTITNCPPIKGGLAIDAMDADGGQCTSAFLAKRLDNGRISVFTAGHCLYVNGGANTHWKHAGNDFGWAGSNTWYNGANGDVGPIAINAEDLPAGGQNQIYTGPATDPNPVRAITSVEHPQAQWMDICATGRGSVPNKRCGWIDLVDETLPSCVSWWTADPCDNIDHQNKVNFDSTGGDSGGPYYYSLTGFGIHTHSDADNAANPKGWYTPLYWAHEAYKTYTGTAYRFCLSNTCSVVWPAP